MDGALSTKKMNIDLKKAVTSALSRMVTHCGMLCRLALRMMTLLEIGAEAGASLGPRG